MPGGTLAVAVRVGLAAFVIASIALQCHVKALALVTTSAQSGKLQGMRAPEFHATDLRGHEVTLSSLRSHGAVLVDFFIVDCIPVLSPWYCVESPPGPVA